MDHLQPDTISRLKERIAILGSQRKAAKALGVAQRVLSDVANNRPAHVSAATENNLRIALGLATVARIEVDCCPDCGGCHTGRCKGRAVEVRPVRKPRLITRWADAPTRELAAAIINRIDY